MVLQSRPNMLILGEEVALSKLTIFDITKKICEAVQATAERDWTIRLYALVIDYIDVHMSNSDDFNFTADKYHGVVLILEGLVESIPEMYALIKEIHDLYNQGILAENISSTFLPWASALCLSFCHRL